MTKHKDNMKENGRYISYIALAISLFSLLITFVQYLQKERPKIALSPESKLLERSNPDPNNEKYTFAFQFENKGNIECKGLNITVQILTKHHTLGNIHTFSKNDIFPGDT